MSSGARVIAIDWSGRSGTDQRRALWLAEAMEGELVRLEGGRSRVEIVDQLIEEANQDPNLIVGLDFAFSLPEWYLLERRLTPRTLWAALADEALTPTMRRLGLARWMNTPEPPFWVTGAGHALLVPEKEFRRTEIAARAAGSQPKSVFQLVGAGQVGRGSLYGMQALHRLTSAGFRIWPFDQRGLPLVVEIFPRLLTGPVRKNSEGERERYLADVPMAARFRHIAALSEDAFDAAVSAIVMAAAVDELLALPEEHDHALEGAIWRPLMPSAVGNHRHDPLILRRRATTRDRRCHQRGVGARRFRGSAGRAGARRTGAERLLGTRRIDAVVDRTENVEAICATLDWSASTRPPSDSAEAPRRPTWDASAEAARRPTRDA